MRFPYTEHAASGLPNPTPLEGEVRFVQAQYQQVVSTRSPRIITECLLTRSMLNVCTCYLQLILNRNYIIYRKHEYEFITTITIKFDESYRS